MTAADSSALPLYVWLLCFLVLLLAGFCQSLYRENRQLCQRGTTGQAGIPATAAPVVPLSADNPGHEQQLVALAFELQECILICDPQGTILRVNQAFTEQTGYTADAVVGQSITLFRATRHDPLYLKGAAHALQLDRSWQGEAWCRRRNGEEYPAWLNVTAVQLPGCARNSDNDSESDRITHYIIAATDLSERKESEAQIRQLAFYDPLTQLPNRRLLMDRLKHAILTSMRYNSHGAVLFIDLDNFKVLNDTKGHHIGDQLLLHVAMRLCNCVRAEDTVARLGGDEFLVMLENLNPEESEAVREVERVAEKIRVSLHQPYYFSENGQAGDGGEFHTTPSIGICLFRGCAIPVEDILKHADLAMYQAKDAGRNTYRFFDPQMQSSLLDRLDLENDLRQALLCNQFLLHFQPQFNSQRQIEGAEVLMRWEKPGKGLIPPNTFIPVAESTHLILPMGHWVLQTVCRQLKAWESDPVLGQLVLAVNVSARQFAQPGFVQEVQEVVEAIGINPSRLKLELTESLLLDNVNEAVEKMQALRALGIGFSLDDFGTGNSCLAYLKRLPLEQLKIDQSFVRDITEDPDDAAIVQAIIGLASHLSLNIIAEGVETAAQCAFLKQHGCHHFQGYFFSRPLALASFESFARQQLVAGSTHTAATAQAVADEALLATEG